MTKSSLNELYKEALLLAPPQHQPLTISSVNMLTKSMKLQIPFETSFGRIVEIPKIFISITFQTKNGDTINGIGECPFLPAPWYDGEYFQGGKGVLEDFLIPQLEKSSHTISNVSEFISLYHWVVDNNIAKVGLEGAYWDAIGKLLGKPVWELWKGTQKQIMTGTSVGLEKTDEEIIEKIKKGLEKNVKRIKIKIKPGRDITLVQHVRTVFPTLPLQVDGNAAYDLANQEHVNLLKQLDAYNLLMIEQPGPNDDIYFHSQLSQQLKTPICLDESILHVRHAYEAIELWEKNNTLERLVINIKPPRIGGFWEAVKIAMLCERAGVATWCGGMLESAVGKMANIHLSTLPAFTMPGDHVSQTPYYVQDVAQSPVYDNGVLFSPSKSGWGIEKLKL